MNPDVWTPLETHLEELYFHQSWLQNETLPQLQAEAFQAEADLRDVAIAVLRFRQEAEVVMRLFDLLLADEPLWGGWIALRAEAQGGEATLESGP